MNQIYKIGIAILALLLWPLINVFSQSTVCSTSEPFCTSEEISFPAGGSTENAESGPCYDCISSYLEDPAWFHMRIAIPGDLEITITNDNSVDIDFICWGPFTSPHDPCSGQLTCAKVVDCGSTILTTEICDITNGQVGEYYILLITNYLSVSCNISFLKTGGAGETDCGIVPAQASNNGPICEGQTLELYAEYINNATYSWSGPNGFSSNQQNPIITNAQLIHAGTYSLVTTVSGNSSNPFPTVVIINANPVADFSFENLCIGDEVQFNDLSTCATPATPIQSWQWNFGDGNTSTLQNPVHAYDPAGPLEYDVTLNVITTGGCENEISKELTLYPLPEAGFSYISACAGDEVEFFDESICINPDTPVVEWLWDFGDGNTSTEQNPLHVYAAGGPTSYSVTLSSTTTAGCENQITLTIDLFENPASDFEYTFSDGSSCIESIVEFDDASTTSEGEIVGWQWDFGDGNTSNQENPSHSYASSGTFIVSLTAENSNGCFDQNQLPITIHDFPVIDFSFNNVCAGSATQFNDSDYIIVDETEEWYYDFGDGNSSNQSNPAHIYQTSGDFVVTFTITDIYGCSSSTQKTVSVFELPIADFTNSTVCLYSPTQFTNQSSSSSGFDFYNWDFGDGATSSIQHPAHTFSTFGYHDVQLIVGSNNGCLDTLVQQVRVLEPPVANFLSSDSACMAGLVYFSDSSYSNESSIVSYLWNFPDGHISFDPNTYFVFLNTDIYYNISLLITDARGCKDTITETLFISPELSMNFNSDTLVHDNFSKKVFI